MERLLLCFVLWSGTLSDGVSLKVSLKIWLFSRVGTVILIVGIILIFFLVSIMLFQIRQRRDLLEDYQPEIEPQYLRVGLLALCKSSHYSMLMPYNKPRELPAG